MKTSLRIKCENNDTETVYCVGINTTSDKVHTLREFVCGTYNNRHTSDISDATFVDTYEEALEIAESHEFRAEGIGRLWGAQINIICYEREYYIDSEDKECINYSENERDLVWQS